METGHKAKRPVYAEAVSASWGGRPSVGAAGCLRG